MLQTTVFIFHRDLRIQDNTALLAALKQSKNVIPCFIFTDTQLTKNTYKSENAIQFMCNSLRELDEELQQKGSKMYVFKGEQIEVLKNVCKQIQIDGIFENKDYTPYAKKREELTKKFCEEQKIAYMPLHDALLHPPQKVRKDNAEPYTVFTPYYNKARTYEIKKPIQNTYLNYYTKDIKGTISIDDINYEKNNQTLLKGGRSEAAKLIEQAKIISNYKEERNFPTIKGVTHLSAHNKFGTVSIREVYHAIKEVDIRRQLYWRDFFYQIADNFAVFGSAFHTKYNRIQWENNEEYFNAWCKGKTGFPIVDAGMRELNETGYMHNRTRMIVASFLTKDLLIDWQKGEKYFATKLLDYDPCVNNGSWQWAASTGCDAQPYFRIFNPWLQQKRFDPDCIYIKKWIPELRKFSAKEIHNIENSAFSDYPKPIINHAIQKEKALKMFKII